MLRKLFYGVALSLLFGSTTFAATTLKRSLSAEPQSLFPPKATDVSSHVVLGDLYEGLVISDMKGKILPGVADKWELDASGTVYTFHLRDSAKWSNGEKITAEDFVYSWRHLINPATASSYAFIMYPVLNAEDINKNKEKDITKLGIKAVDPNTLQITLRAPTPYFVPALLHYAFFPIHKASFEKHKNQVARPGNLVSNGAYILTDLRPQTLIELKKNKNYWDAEHVKIDKVQYYTIEDANAKVKKFRAGEIDMTLKVPADKIRFIKSDAKLKNDLRFSPYLGTYYYGINLNKGPLGKSKELREALSLVLDRERLTREVSRAGEEPAYSFVPPQTANNKPVFLSFKDMPMAERIKRAQDLYKKAGYSKVKPLEIEFTYNTDESHKKLAIACADMWGKALGVKVKLLNKEWKVFLADRRAGNVEMFRGGWIGDYNDPYSFLELMSSNSQLNDVGFKDSKYDELLKTGAATTDLAARAEILSEAQKIFLDAHAIIPIYYYVTARLVSPKIKGYEIGGNNLLDICYSKDLEIAG